MMEAVWKRRSSDEGGFTLVELLVVIAILGILSAVAVFAISGTTAQSKSAACKADVASVQTASDAWYARKGTYAASMAAMNAAGADQTLRSVPATTNYTIAYDSATGTASNTLNCVIP